MRRWMALMVAVGAVFAAPVSGAAGKDYARTALNIIPSGQWGGLPVNPNADSQARMYDGLTPLFDNVSNADLTTYFKSERFGAQHRRTRHQRARSPGRGDDHQGSLQRPPCPCDHL